jgi:uncharacterized membrane protein
MDLALIVILTLTTWPLVYVIPFEAGRISLGLLLVLFFPGYVITAAAYPTRRNLNGPERIALSVGLSIALIPLLGIGIHFSPWKIHLTPIMVALSSFTLVMSGFAWVKRRRTPPDDRYAIAWEPRKLWPNWAGRRLDVVVISFAGLLVLLLVGLTVSKIQMDPHQSVETDFYLLGTDGRLEDYPAILQAGESQEYNLAVINGEEGPNVYSILALLNGEEVGSVTIPTLANNQKWEGQISVTAEKPGDEQKLILQLSSGANAQFDQSLYLFVDVNDH